MTGGLDDSYWVCKNKFEKYKGIIARRVTIVNTIDEQGKMTAELKKSYWKLLGFQANLRIYIFPTNLNVKRRPKLLVKTAWSRPTKILMNQMSIMWDKPLNALSTKKLIRWGFARGARDIIAEWISENETTRNIVRHRFSQDAVITSKVVKAKQEEALIITEIILISRRNYHFSSSHRLLAIHRGEKVLRVRYFATWSWRVLEQLKKIFVKTEMWFFKTSGYCYRW